MDISILFSSFNGSATIKKMLTSLAGQIELDGVSWEIVAVDNNSTDETSEIIQSFEGTLPIKRLFEPKQGKNIALNRGLREAKGDLIILTDDDVIASPDWVSQYYKHAGQYSEFSIFGGSITPSWPFAPEKTLLREIPIVTAFALTNGEDHVNGEIDPCSLFGPNMAVRKQVFTKLEFNELIGPSGKNYVMGSETDFLHRAKGFGYKALYSNKLKVKHIIRDFQLTNTWLENRAFKAGRALVHETIRKGEHDLAGKTLHGYPRWAIGDFLFKRIVLLKMTILSRGRDGFYKALWDAYFIKGYLFEYKNSTKK